MEHLQFPGDGDDNAALSGAVQLSKDDPGASGNLLELLGLDQPILPCCSKNNFLRCG